MEMYHKKIVHRPSSILAFALGASNVINLPLFRLKTSGFGPVHQQWTLTSLRPDFRAELSCNT